MKVLFVIENFFPYHDASAKVLHNLLTSKEFDDCEIHVLANGTHDFCDGNIIIHHFSYKDSPIYKFRNKIHKGYFIKNNNLIKTVSNRINDVCLKYGINKIVLIVGNMNLLLCEVNPKIQINIVYYDPFLQNFFYKKESQNNIANIENNIFNRAHKIFLLEEYIDAYKKAYPLHCHKFINFYVTAFYEMPKTAAPEKGLMVHAGAFLPQLRDPISFFDFLSYLECSDKDIHAITLGVLPKVYRTTTLPKNLIVKERVFDNDYQNIVSKAEYLVLVDNCKACNQIPSKTFEYLGYNKKIIFFTEDDTNTSRILSGNNNVFKICNTISKETIKSFEQFASRKIVDERKKYYKNEVDFVAKIMVENIS